MTRTAFALAGFLALVACGADNDLVPIEDGLLDPPSSTQKPSGSSSSSSGTTQPPTSGTSTSSSSSSGATPPPVAEAPCASNADYTGYTPVLGLPADASWLRLTGDELHAFYVQPGAGTARIFSTQRAAIGAPFEAGTELGAGVNLASVLSDPLPSDDGLTLRYTANGNSVYVANRASIADPFGQATLALGDAKSMVVARDGSVVLYSRYLQFPSYYPKRWFVFGQQVGAAESLFLAANPDVDAYPTWYEPLSRQAWVARGDETLIFVWDGAHFQGAAATDFRVSWTSPNGCRLYGRHADAIVVRSRVPSPPAADAGADAAN